MILQEKEAVERYKEEYYFTEKFGQCDKEGFTLENHLNIQPLFPLPY